MNEDFILNFRRIIDQNLQIYNSFQSKGCVTESKNVDDIINMTQKQLLFLKPTVILPRLEQIRLERVDSTINSTRSSNQSEFMGFPDGDDSRSIEVEVDLCNEGSIASNIQQIKSIIETEDHEIPFIDVRNHSSEKISLLNNEEEKIVEKPVEKVKMRRGRKKKLPENIDPPQTPRSKTPLMKEPSITLQSSETEINYDFSSLDNSELQTFTESQNTLNRTRNAQDKKDNRKSLRTRKPVMSSSYYDAVEPSPKRKRKSKQDVSTTDKPESVLNDFLKIDALPQSAIASEIQIHFPKSLPIKDGKFKISVDLGKLNLPPEVFKAITKPSPQKSTIKSSKNLNLNHIAPQEKSDIVKYLEIFSSDCENQNIEESTFGSPICNSTVANIPLPDSNTAPQIENIVILHPNQSNDQTSAVGNVISVDSSGVVIGNTSKQLINSHLDNHGGTAISAPINSRMTTSNASAGQAATGDGTQMEDFEFPLDIDNSVYRLYEYIENGTEIFPQVNSNQISQMENVVRSTSAGSTANTQTKPVNQQSSLSSKNTNDMSHRRHSVQVDKMPATSHSPNLPELCENRNPAHSHKNKLHHRCVLMCGEVLDLSVQKEKGSKKSSLNDNVMDLTVSSSFLESTDNEQEYSNTSSKDLTKDVPQQNSAQVQRISIEEYQRRQINTERNTPPESPQEKDTNKKKATKFCGKNFISYEDNCLINDPLDYEHDEQIDKLELPSFITNKTVSTFNYADQSPATKDSGIDSEDCGNKSTGKSSNVSLRGDSTPVYRSKDEGLKSCHEIDDDALSIFINSVAGSPFYFSENNDGCPEDDDGSNSVENNVSTIKTPPINSPLKEKSNCNESSDMILNDDISNGSSGPKKVFKIPKLVASTSKSADAVYNTSVLNDFETNFLFPENSTNTDTTVRPVSEPSLNSLIQNSVQTLEKSVCSRNNDVIGNMFGIRPCFLYLAGNCQKPSCKFSHEIIDCNVLQKRLMNSNHTTLHCGYNFISRNKDLFKLYFPAFCELFSQRGDRRRLLAMIRDCQLYTETSVFLKLIVQGFRKTGMSQIDATKFVIENFISSTTEAMDVLVDLILDTDIIQFLPTLESFVMNPRYRFKMEAIDKLAYKCNRTKHFDIIQLLLKIILFQMPKGEVKNFESIELVKFLDMVRNSQMTRTVQNVYDNCVNNNKPDVTLNELLSTNRASLPSMPSLAPLPLTSFNLNTFVKRC